MSASGTRTASLRVGVLGAGQMGSGIAAVLADAGHGVKAWDERAAALAALDEACPGVTAATSLEDAVEGAELVIEAIAEDMTAKLALYARVSALNGTCVLASNTSSLPVQTLSAGVANPARFAIAHFFFPPRLVPLVEIVPGPATADETLETLRSVLEAAGKLPVVLHKAVPGFVANRLQAALYREAYALAAEGVAKPEDIDLVVRAGLGSRWAAAGPMMVTDLGGQDIWKAVTTQLFPLLSNATTTPRAIDECVAAGNLGAKTGKGIYEHTKAQDDAIRDRMGKHFELEFGKR